jgi:hypothetical protein
VRRFAERLYFHRRNDAGIDREEYVRWLGENTPAARRALSES